MSVIRAGRPQDSEAIAELWNWMIRETLATFTTQEKSRAEIFDLIRARQGQVLVAEESGELLGFATFGSFRSGPGYAATCEHSVVVSPKAHGRGIGRALMADLEQAAIDKGIHVLVGAISGANPPAIAFHKALGFAESGRMPEVGRKNGRWLDLVLMQKILGAGG